MELVHNHECVVFYNLFHGLSKITLDKDLSLLNVSNR